MSTYTVKKMPGEPIVMITSSENFNPTKDVGEAVQVVNRLLDQLNEPVTFIQDLSAMKVNWDDIMVGANATSRGSEAPFHHRNIGEIISVTQDPVMKQVLASMESGAFNVRILLFDTLDQALAHARKR